VWGLDVARVKKSVRVTTAIVLASMLTFVPELSVRFELSSWAAVRPLSRRSSHVTSG
jgi:hypothetical protein